MSDFETWWQQEGQEFLFALNTTTDDDIKLVAEIAWKNGAYYAEQAEQEPIRFVWNGEGWIEADEYVWKTTPDAERRELYATQQPNMNLNCKSVQKRLATVWGYVKAEQAEQEPVWWHYRINDNWDGFDRNKPDDDVYDEGTLTPLYTAPVRTKDMTDDEKLELARSSIGKSRHWLVEAAIAADREKNK